MPGVDSSIHERIPRRGMVTLMCCLCAPGGAACGGGDGAPVTGSLVVQVITAGDTLDHDGYLLTAAGSSRQVAVNDSAAVEGLPAGQVTVTLSGVAVNCRIEGEPSRTVDIRADEASGIAFALECAPALLGRIVFARYLSAQGQLDVHAMNPDGSGLLNLSNHPARDDSPSVSPDGTRIAFVSNRDGDVDLFVMNADGSNPVNLTRTVDPESDPAWSPDGTRIAFACLAAGQGDICVMNADGTGRRNVTQDAQYDRHPSWSPDGSSLVFDTNDRTPDTSSEIWVIGVDGTGLRRVFGAVERESVSPSWSPDGSAIAFSSDVDDKNNAEIYVIRPDGSGLRRLTFFADQPNDDQFPAWSPDGTRIAFRSEAAGNREVYVIDADGSGATRLTHNAPGDDERPVWTPPR